MTELRFALRSLLKSPGFTIVALLTLALGIGVNTSMFSVINALLLQDLPFAAPDELVRVYRTSPQSRSWPHSSPNFLDYQAQSRSFRALAVYAGTSYNYSAPGRPAERLRGMDVTADFFPLLGIAAELGRTFSPEETRPGAAPVVVLSHAAWVRRFAAAPDVIGRHIRLNSRLVTVVGVMPEAFVPRLLWGPVEAFQPLVFDAARQQDRGNNWLAMIGRLAPAVSREQAQAEMSGLAARLAAAYPQSNAANGIRIVPLSSANQDDSSGPLTWLALGLAGFVLLIACANLANLQFTRTASRAREHAIRVALGATRWQVMRELLVESLLVGLIGGALGVLVALWCNDLLGGRLHVAGDSGLPLPLDLRVLGFAMGMSVLSGLTFGLLPAWLASRTDVNGTLKLGSRGIVAGTARLRHALLVIEVALALVLLAGAGMFIRGLDRFNLQDPGWRTGQLLTGSINLPDNQYPDDASRRAFFTRLDETLAANPQITRATVASSLPTRGYNSSTTFVVQGRPAPLPGRAPLANMIFVTPGYVDTLGLRLLQGRFFNADDRDGHPLVVVIDENMARSLWPGENPVGQRLGGTDPADPVREIIGVISHADAPASISPADTPFQMYYPLAQESFGFASVALRGRVEPDMLAETLRRAVAAIDPDQPVSNVVSVRREIDRSLANVSLLSGLLGGFALLGLALAAIGIYGVLSSYVVQRTQEIGIRLALGAQIGTVRRMILGRGLRFTLLGIAIGLAGAYGLTRLLGAILPALGRAEVLTLPAVAAVLLAVALLACWFPARRATRVDPIVALRAE